MTPSECAMMAPTRSAAYSDRQEERDSSSSCSCRALRAPIPARQPSHRPMSTNEFKVSEI
ncbi:hypothetical protein TYRP_010535 [Tyrophagus putrescentiae]|nr:hypothetical protein TYRP_010535 [Tyrophagus putrescentiae]